MDVRFKRLNDLAKIPTRGSKFSAGYDLYAATDYDIPNEVDKWIKNHLEDWQEYDKEENNKMADSYTVISWSKENGEQKTTYDISETANKIRAKWRNEYIK